MADEKPEKEDAPAGGQRPMQLPELTEIDMLSAKIAELENNLAQSRDQLLRKAAEFENFKKRVENDFASIVRFSNEDLILKLLPVLDDFERSLKSGGGAEPASAAKGSGAAAAETAQDGAFRRGIELIYNKFRKILETQGVRTMDVVGKPFDPHLHEALLQVPRADVPHHTVVEEVDKGYMLNDKVLRHAKVVVSADASDGTPEGGGTQ
jgi:molecular chaperone GrpE